MTYDWEVQNLPAVFHVDMQYAPEPEKLNGHTCLLFLTCSSKHPKKTGFSALEKMCLDKLLKNAQKVLGNETLFVGYIDLNCQRRYYFYTADPRLVLSLSELAHNESFIHVECSRTDEPGFDTYYYFLFPDDAKYQTIVNKEYINSLAKKGDDTSASRRINLHFCFPSLGSANPFLEEAKNLGFAIGKIDCNEAYELPYCITLHIIAPLESRTLNSITTRAIYAAQKNAGVISRLDCEFVPKNRF